MKRQLRALGVVFLCLVLIAVALQATQANASVAISAEQDFAALATQSPTLQSTTETTQIESALLTSPDQCAAPCFWQFQPGQNTVRQFKQLALGIFTNADPAYADSNYELGGKFDKGVALHTSVGSGATLDSTVDYVYIRLDPAAAQAAGINVAAISPASLIRKFGNPDGAFLLFNADRPQTYRLILLYSAHSVLYIIRGTFQNGKACLTLTGVNNLSLYRFANAAAATQFISLTAGSTGLPPSITQYTQQKLTDFTKMAQNPTTNCLTLN